MRVRELITWSSLKLCWVMLRHTTVSDLNEARPKYSSPQSHPDVTSRKPGIDKPFYG